MRTNILMLLGNHFDPDSRVKSEMQSLAKSGSHVTVRCYWDVGLKKEEVDKNIRIERILYLPRKIRPLTIKKIFLALLFLLTSLKDTKKFNVIHCHDLLTLPIGVIGKWINRTNQKVIYDSHEYQTEQSGKPKWLKAILRIVERFFIKYSDHVITVSDSIAEEYKRIYRIEKPSVVLNCPPFQDADKKDYFRGKFKLDSDTIIYLYQGGFSENRGIEEIIQAFATISDPKKVVVFMGYGRLEQEIISAANLHDNIYHHDAVKQDVLAEYTASADVGILTYKNTCLNHYYCSPNKLFEYTMAGLPVIVSNLYELSRLIKKYNNGFVLEDNSANGLKSILENIRYEDIKNKQKNAFSMRKEFSWEQQEKILLNLYDTINLM